MNLLHYQMLDHKFMFPITFVFFPFATHFFSVHFYCVFPLLRQRIIELYCTTYVRCYSLYLICLYERMLESSMSISVTVSQARLIFFTLVFNVFVSSLCCLTWFWILQQYPNHSRFYFVVLGSWEWIHKPFFLLSKLCEYVPLDRIN